MKLADGVMDVYLLRSYVLYYEGTCGSCVLMLAEQVDGKLSLFLIRSETEAAFKYVIAHLTVFRIYSQLNSRFPHLFVQFGTSRTIFHNFRYKN